MVYLSYKFVRVIMIIAAVAICSGIAYGIVHAVIRYRSIHSSKQKAVEVSQVVPANILKNGQFTRFDAPGGFSNMFRFTDPENGNTIYWWEGEAVVVPGKKTR